MFSGLKANFEYIFINIAKGFACIKEIEIGFKNNSFKENRKIVFYKIIIEIPTQT
jgi:hypothetical protein